MRVRANCVDFTSTAPINGCSVTCEVTVAPRFRVEGPGGGIDTAPPPVADQPIGDGGNGGDLVGARLVIDEAQAIRLPAQTAITGRSGRVSFVIDAGPTYQSLIEANQDFPTFGDVVALVALRAVVDGLERASAPILSTTSEESATGDVFLDRLVLIDFAQAIVGHTTDRVSRLWFRLHTPQLPGRRYELEIDQLDSTGRPRTTQPLRVMPVSFDAQGANTRVVDVENLEAGTSHRFRLWLRPGNVTRPREGRVLCGGSFTTASPDEQRLTFFFGSCHRPLDTGFYNPARDLLPWRRLADVRDGDLLLLTGDQIYGDRVAEPTGAGRWFDGYVRCYGAFWAFQPLRQAWSMRPTYMIPDDHDVTDDWGINHNLSPERIADAELAIRLFQLAHSPSGFAGSLHYHFRRGPAAFFLMDGRSVRGQDSKFPIFGRRQWEDIKAWAASQETRTADVVVFVSPVAPALLPIEKLRAVAEALAAAGGAATGALAGAGVGFLIGGPAGAAVGAEIGAFAGAAGGSIAHDQIEDEALLAFDAPDMWAFAPNQVDLVRLLDLLFGLANDTQTDGRPGPRPRVVLVLGGDAHFGLIHTIGSNHDGGDDSDDHRTNPLIIQLLSSAIGRPPQDSEPMRILFENVDESPPDFDSIAADLLEPLDEIATEFILDDKKGDHYRAKALGALFERNLGRIHLERAGAGRRYRFEMTIEGETRTLVQLFEVDLDARPVRWRSLVGQVLAVEGRVSLVRVNEIGDRFGPVADQLEVEVVVQLNSAPNRSFGFQLRRDANRATREQMLTTVRDAFNHGGRLRVEYRRTGIRNGEIIRVLAMS